MVGAALTFLRAQRPLRIGLLFESIEERGASALGDLTGIVGSV
jgi:hypothetical protein